MSYFVLFFLFIVHCCIHYCCLSFIKYHIHSRLFVHCCFHYCCLLIIKCRILSLFFVYCCIQYCFVLNDLFLCCYFLFVSLSFLHVIFFFSFPIIFSVIPVCCAALVTPEYLPAVIVPQFCITVSCQTKRTKHVFVFCFFVVVV